MLNEETRATLAQRLWDAEAGVTPIAPLTDDHPDLTPDDVAERMGVSVGAVKRHLARARKRLGEWLA